MHAEKGDGGLTDVEHRTLEACPHTHVVTIPGAVFFFRSETTERSAELVLEALAAVPSQQRARRYRAIEAERCQVL